MYNKFGVYLNSKKDVICVDGDGAFFMHMGNVATLGAYAKKILNTFYLITMLMNQQGSTTISDKINFKKIASGFGLKNFMNSKLKMILKKN